MAPESLRFPVAEAAGGALPLDQTVVTQPFARRVLNWRTLLSFGVALAILVLAFKKAGIHWHATLQAMGNANAFLFILAFVVYYATFPLRGHRWRMLLRNANQGHLRTAVQAAPVRDLTQIIYLSYFVNAVVPAKLGDIYRAYLARRWIGVTVSRTVGTILAERILDLVVLFPLLLLAAVLTFPTALFSSHDGNIRLALAIGLGLALAAVCLLLLVWFAGDYILRLLPHRLHEVFTHFRHGASSAFGRNVPALIGETVLVWLLEGARFACILAALGLLASGHHGVGLGAALFLALGSTVLTTLPFTPAGLGLVEPFIVSVLAMLAVPGGATTGAAVAVLERVVSYLSIVVFGFILYICSGRAHLAGAARTADPAG